jgi:hypothetical protein
LVIYLKRLWKLKGIMSLVFLRLWSNQMSMDEL